MQAPIGVSAHDSHRLNDSGAPSRRTGAGHIPNSASRHSGTLFRVRDGGYTPNPTLHTDAQDTHREQQHNSVTTDASTREAPNTFPEEGAIGSVLDHTHHLDRSVQVSYIFLLVACMNLTRPLTLALKQKVLHSTHLDNVLCCVSG